MNAPAWDSPPEAGDLRAALLELHDPLEVIARDILGCGSRVDWVVRDPEGRVGLVHRAEPGQESRSWPGSPRGWLTGNSWHRSAASTPRSQPGPC
ncbi:MAG: hypothetical protein JRH01_18775 [Deltaproteobacteria bacterium]|nr:hypothetical protein [Deltaproteobacteria bacterium]